MEFRGEKKLDVLENKREATCYQILVEIADRQPAVNQKEVADSIGVSSQAVSEYLKHLSQQRYVEKLGRGRYKVTKEGTDWLISQTNSLRDFTEYVSEEVISEIDTETAIATDSIKEGEKVSLFMENGVLRADPNKDETEGATAIAITDSDPKAEVAVTDFEGIIDYELGEVTILSVPKIENGGSESLDSSFIQKKSQEKDLIAISGVEAYVAVKASGLSPDIRFGVSKAVKEAATKGLNVFLVSVSDEVPGHVKVFDKHNIKYEVLDRYLDM